MSLLTRRRDRREPEPEFAGNVVGNATVVHPRAGMTTETQVLALTVAEDAEYDLVVVDLPPDAPVTAWEAIAKAVPKGKRGVRLIIGGRSREMTALAGQWLAERLNRTVVAPDGAIVRATGGNLFVHSGRGSGWVRCRPGSGMC